MKNLNDGKVNELSKDELKDIKGGMKYERDSECFMFYDRDPEGNVYGFIGGWYA